MKVIIIKILKGLLNLIENKEVQNKSAEITNKKESNKESVLKRNKWGFPVIDGIRMPRTEKKIRWI